MFNRYRLTGIIIALALIGLFGWWFVAASTARQEIATFTAMLEKQGWRARPGESSISGMPLRINYNLEKPEIATQSGAWRWSAAEAHIRRLLYRSNVYQLGAPGAHRLTTPLGAIEAGFETAAASLRFGGGGSDKDLLSRLSVVFAGMKASEAEAGRIEAHLGLIDPSATTARKVFAKARALKIGRAQPVDLTLKGDVLFDRPLSRAGTGTPQAVRVNLQSEDATGPGFLLRFETEEGKSAELQMTAKMTRKAADDALLGWRVEASFETDQGAEVIEQLAAMGLLDAASQQALRARLARSGRLAGVLKIDGDKVTVLDIAPEEIRLRAR